MKRRETEGNKRSCRQRERMVVGKVGKESEREDTHTVGCVWSVWDLWA